MRGLWLCLVTVCGVFSPVSATARYAGAHSTPRGYPGAGARATRIVMQQSSGFVGLLQRVSALRNKVIVVKYGGHAMTNDEHNIVCVLLSIY